MEQLKKFLKKPLKSLVLKMRYFKKMQSLYGRMLLEKHFEHIKSHNVDKGVLFIKVESATWKQELYMQKNEN